MGAPLVEFSEQANPRQCSGNCGGQKFQIGQPGAKESGGAGRDAGAGLAGGAHAPSHPLRSFDPAGAGSAGDGRSQRCASAGANRFWLLAGIGFLGLNWLGDGLDGTLARVRQNQRPRYGFYVDHILDSFGARGADGTRLAIPAICILWIAMGMLIAFLLLSIESYLATYTLGEFRLSFWTLGPTELRILLAAGNLALLRWPLIFHGRYRLFDIGGMVGLMGMGAMLVFFTARNTRRLYREERIRRGRHRRRGRGPWSAG